VDGETGALLRINRYDAATDTLTLLPAGAETFRDEIGIWNRYFEIPTGNGGLPVKAVSDPQELHDLTAFFTWAAWSSVAERPGTNHSYTNNFPYDPLAGNQPTGAALLWSAISFIALLGGTAIVLLAFGKFDYLGWHGMPSSRERWTLSASQTATLKFMAVAVLLFLGQALIGAGVAHYRAEPSSFYGIDLSWIFPSNLLRAWHLQTAIFWIATSYVAGALFVAELLGGKSPRGQALGIHILFAAILMVVAGSLLGEWASLVGWLPKTWFWLGDQGWEFLEIGRAWQVLLALGMVFWFFLLWRNVGSAWRDPERGGLITFFLIAAAAIPVFYLPALLFDGATHYTIVDTWRFWIIHLWVEGFFELFVTVIVAIIFYELGLVERLTALRAIYLDVILVFGGGLIGTGHHWYFTGQTEFNMALSSAFSALEVVPLTLITLDAWGFVSVTRGDAGGRDRDGAAIPPWPARPDARNPGRNDRRRRDARAGCGARAAGGNRLSRDTSRSAGQREPEPRPVRQPRVQLHGPRLRARLRSRQREHRGDGGRAGQPAGAAAAAARGTRQARRVGRDDGLRAGPDAGDLPPPVLIQ
jgi:nitric oxide reductase subunit B